jgi:Leucine-rich repeat (LRR) protein
MNDVKELKNLTHLDLDNTKVTDAGFKQLKELKNLTDLDLAGAKITAAGLKEFRSALPKCFIFN